jgi:hypothetical protein
LVVVGIWELPPGLIRPIVSGKGDLFHKIFNESKISGMKILFERTGGFTGRKLRGTLDSTDLPPNQVHQLKKLLKKSRFFELPAELELPNPGADQFNYKVTVENENGRHTVEASDGAIPGEMRPLLDFLARSFRNS